jgi:hypothetical protein
MFRASIFIIATIVLTRQATAHDGPRVWIGNTAGKITTFKSDNDFDPSTYHPARAFGATFDNLFDIYTTEFPGFEVRRDGGGVPEETRFGFNITSPLLRFDPVAQSFDSTPPTLAAVPGLQPSPSPRLLITQSHRERRSALGFVAGFDFFDFFGMGDHSHLAFTYLGSGDGIGQTAAGIYAIGLELTSPTLQKSAPFFVVFGKGVASTDPAFVQALNAAESTAIPEPSSITLILPALSWCLRRRAQCAHLPHPEVLRNPSASVSSSRFVGGKSS